MKALTWQGRRDVRVDTVPDPVLREPDDIIVRITSTGLCGSDLHLYEVLGPFLEPGDILGHEAMGVVEETGPGVTAVRAGDRVVVPFNMSCGNCFMCGQGLHSQCETSQVRDQGMGGSLFGYTKLYGQVPGGQAEYLRVPFGIPDGGTLVVLGLGPIGDMSARIALHRGAERVIGVDLVPERLARARERGVETIDLSEHGDDLVEIVRDRTNGRGPDSVIDAVGMEAHGSPVGKLAQQIAGLLPDAVSEKMMRTGGVDRMQALYHAIDLVRRGGTISLSGVYGGMADPMPMLTMFDKQIQLRMGQANVHRWVGDILPLLTDDDPLGVDTFATHHVGLDHAPEAYEMFQQKTDGAVKVLFRP